MDNVVVGLEEMVDTASREPHWYGMAGYGPNLFQEIWKNECHIFNAGGEVVGLGPGVSHLGHPDRTAANTLNWLPVDVLAKYNPNPVHIVVNPKH